MAILLMGAIESLPTRFYLELSTKDKLLIVEEESHPRQYSNKKNIISFNSGMSDKDFSALFKTYEIEYAVYLSQSIDNQKQRSGEMHELQVLLDFCVRNGLGKIMYVSSLLVHTSDAAEASRIENSKRLSLQLTENIFNYYRQSHQLEILSIQIPYLYDLERGEFFSDEIARSIAEKKEILITYLPKQACDFLSIDDFLSFLIKTMDYWIVEINNVCLSSDKGYTYIDLQEEVVQLGGTLRFVSGGRSSIQPICTDDLRGAFGWFPVRDFLNDLPSKVVKEQETMGKSKKIFFRNEETQQTTLKKKVIPVFELIVFWILMEVFNKVTETTVQFRYVDFRLLMVVIMALQYGMIWGIVSAGIASISSIYHFIALGTSWQILFYNIENWIPFATYFLIGSILGFRKNRQDDQIDILKQKEALLEQKQVFLQELYTEVSLTNEELEHQLLINRESFARAASIIQQLQQCSRQDIYRESVDILSNILGNNTIAIYILKNDRFLLAAKSDQFDLDSILSDDISGIILEGSASGRVWFNSQADALLPHYIFALNDQMDQLYGAIIIYHVTVAHMSVPYSNLFQSISGLISQSLMYRLDEPLST